jgi:hypothetical protein
MTTNTGAKGLEKSHDKFLRKSLRISFCEKKLAHLVCFLQKLIVDDIVSLVYLKLR